MGTEVSHTPPKTVKDISGLWNPTLGTILSLERCYASKMASNNSFHQHLIFNYSVINWWIMGQGDSGVRKINKLYEMRLRHCRTFLAVLRRWTLQLQLHFYIKHTSTTPRWYLQGTAYVCAIKKPSNCWRVAVEPYDHLWLWRVIEFHNNKLKAHSMTSASKHFHFINWLVTSFSSSSATAAASTSAEQDTHKS